MATTLAQALEELKSQLQYLDKALLGKALEFGRQQYKAILEVIDDRIASQRPKGLRIEHRRAVCYQTCLGPVRVSRRIYKDGSGKRRSLLDELMGMGRRDHTTLTVKEYAVELPTRMPYRAAAAILGKLTAIELAHQTLHCMVKKVAAPCLEKERQERQLFMQTGELPENDGRAPARLMVEADGVMVSQQRQKERKVEVKLGIAYEGWREISRDRYCTVNKTVFATVGGGGDAFWSGMTLKLQKRYDLAGVGQVIVGGDGASWVKEGAGYMGGNFQLDRYHLQRELTAALGRDQETKSRVWQAIELGEPAVALNILKETQPRAQGEQSRRLAHACSYLQSNLDGIRDYRLDIKGTAAGLRRTGAIEGNVDKFVARRMKNQGMSWSVRGISSLLCIRRILHENNLGGWLSRPFQNEIPNLPARKVRRIINNLSMQEPDGWLKAGVPALRGPHAARPWVNQLRSLVETPTL